MKKCGSKCNGATIALTLVIIGAMNWLLIGIFNWNIVGAILGNIQWLERLVYILVGLSGVMMLVQCPCKKCKGGSCDTKDMKCGSCDAKDCVCVPEAEVMMEKEIAEIEEELASSER